MSISDPAGRHEPATAPEAEVPEQAPLAAEVGDPDPVIEETELQVGLQRSVRYSRVILGGAVVGALIAALISLLFPIEEGAEYTMGQVVGFMLLIGAALGLAVGGVFSLILGMIAKRQRGTGVAIQADMR
ncbi:hypothetical protein JD276_02120 [Leucobacter sp. CSA1]|uniref:Uncharacterized protein n=1 Tax=Leucobacter chromiisoli TaxID=2796471 RepID=A0A934UTY3_9MICO|nr:hypothetical protein [Leucobacter chromiisoli]MBK0417831.1 hypothetical protein [Leucobacter chromiisoli]